MLKTEGKAVEHHPVDAENISKICIVLDIAMAPVVDHRIIQVGKVLSDLVPTTCFESRQDERKTGCFMPQADGVVNFRSAQPNIMSDSR